MKRSRGLTRRPRSILSIFSLVDANDESSLFFLLDDFILLVRMFVWRENPERIAVNGVVAKRTVTTGMLVSRPPSRTSER